METSLEAAIKRVCRAGYILALFALALLCGLNATTYFFDDTARWGVVVIGMVPPIMFWACLYFFENRTLAGKGHRLFLWKSLVTVVLLFVPPFVLIVRFRFQSVDSIGFLKFLAQIPLVFFAVGHFKSFLSNRVSEPLLPLADHLKYVMWDSWSHFGFQLSPDIAWNSKRSQKFVSLENLKVFQKTLTCPIVDSLFIAEKGACKWGNGSTIDIIDIGGGDGALTAALINHLRKNSIATHEVMMIDPVDWVSHYRQQLIATNPLVMVKQVSLMDAPMERQYDLVLASHSLYSDLDGDKITKRGEVLSKLNQWRKPDGLAIVSLASRYSMALRFKNRAFELMFGRPVGELAAEDLLSDLAKQGAETEYVDNLIDLTELINEATGGDSQRLRSWLDYFLRFPVSEDPRLSSFLQKELQIWVQPFESLPQVEQRRYSELGLKFSRTALILPHKTAIWTIGIKNST